jgi:hydrocephalus-inducing protein
LDIPAKGSAEYELVYRPLSMTGQKADPVDGDSSPAAEDVEETKILEESSDGRPLSHNGSCFFALPDGTGILYNLMGTAEAPVAAGELKQSGPAKQRMTFVMPVENWLKRRSASQLRGMTIPCASLDRR